MNVSLWLDEEMEEAQEEMKKNTGKKGKTGNDAKCACGRAVCCGKHKGGQCSCCKNQKERS